MDFSTFTKILYLYIIVLRDTAQAIDECPKKCLCKRTNALKYVKIRCGDPVPIGSLEELDLTNLAQEIIQLNLSRNHLTTFIPKVNFIALQKLDLSKNQLSVLYDNQFLGVPNLRRLDLSDNNIKSIDTLAFAGLYQLERLRLNQNQLNTIDKLAFKPLEALNQLDISSNPLTCDCDLLWLLATDIKLISTPKCNSPATFKGVSLRKIQIGVDMHCTSPARNHDFPILGIKPNRSQVVFEGDPLMLTCTAPNFIDSSDLHSNINIEWLWLDTDPKKYFDNIEIKTRFSVDTGLIVSSLSISALSVNHTGIWNCALNSTTRGVNVVVISDETKYCPAISTVDSKGAYLWPTTIVNYSVSIPCESVYLNHELSEQKAEYYCSSSGEWIHLNTSQCAYTSEITKILEQFAKVNVTKDNIYESAKHFRNFTSSIKIFQDSVDLYYAIGTIGNYIDYLSDKKELAGVLMDILNNFLNLPKKYLDEVEAIYHLSSKIREFSERISEYATATVLRKSNIAIEEFRAKQDIFAGMTCTWYIHATNSSDRMFYCVTPNRPLLSGMQDRVVEASIQIPASLFYQLKEQNIILDSSIQKLLVIMFSNSKLFPLDRTYAEEYSSNSAVIGIKLANISIVNLTNPIYVMLHIPPPRPVFRTSLVPVWWNATSNNGKGNWSTEGCQLSHEVQDNIVFHCQHLGYYGLLQNVTYMNVVAKGAKFKLSHPAVYVGSSVLFLCLFVVIITYSVCYIAIQMPKKAKHSLVNMWISIVLLIFTYVFGIYQTEDRQLCQIIGISLHYLTLCSLFWMCVVITTMYKRLNKDITIELQDDDLPSDQPIQKPILGLYLIGWGIALIVCGISGAVNMKEYASHNYCFLSSTPALSALFIPCFVLLLILSALFLLVHCAIVNLDANGHLSEGTQVTENVDLDLLEPSFPIPDRASIHSNSSKTRSSEVEDAEHAPATQLKAHIIFLSIYLLTWLSCAFSTAKPFKFQYEETAFSITYAVFAIILGAFTVFFYCVARNDIRTQWVLLRNWIKRNRTRNVSDRVQNVINITAPADLHITSRSSSRTSSHTKSNNSNIVKAATNLNITSSDEQTGARINNVNLVILHRQQYRSNNIAAASNLIENPAQVFYNPYQSTVARRFFKRQRKHMMKHNNLNIPKDNTQSEFDLSSNTKVKNINIHVEHVRKIKHHNPNVFSDSREDINIVPIEKLMMNAERIRRRELNRPRTRKKQNVPVAEYKMRTVSQQCSLEYSSNSTLNNKELQQLELSETVPRIYVNPSHDLIFPKRVQSRCSSVSTGELDELYQQIRRGSKTQQLNIRLSNPELNLNVDNLRYNRSCSANDISDNHETIV